jgi:hypothetical protein
MAIVYPLDMPSNPTGYRSIQQVKLRGRPITGLTESPFTYQQQTFEYPGARWEADVVLFPMQRSQAADWIAFLLSLNGRSGTFYLGDPDAAAPQGRADATGEVDDADQSGRVLKTRSWTPNLVPLFKAGDYIALPGPNSYSRLHQVTKTVNSDADGKATLDIWPILRESPAPGSIIYTTSCRGTFRLATDPAEWEENLMGAALTEYHIQFSAVEAL